MNTMHMLASGIANFFNIVIMLFHKDVIMALFILYDDKLLVNLN